MMEIGWAADNPRAKTRTIPAEERENNFREVDLALTEEEALLKRSAACAAAFAPNAWSACRLVSAGPSTMT